MKLVRIVLILLTITLGSVGATAQEVALGSAFNVGETWWYVQQTNTVGKMIARDDSGGVHFAWTKTADIAANDRHAFYNFCGDDNDVAAQLEANSHLGDAEARAGYTSMALAPREGEQAAALFYHGGSMGQVGRACMSFDFSRGWGAFSQVRVSMPNGLNPISVKGAVGPQGRAQILAGTHFMDGSAGFPIVLVGLTANGDNWRVGEPAILDTLTYLSHLTVASQASEKTAVVWHHNLVGVPAPQGWEGRTEYTMNADIHVLESENGVDWDLGNRINITRTVAPDQNREGTLIYGDTLRPFSDLDAIYVDDVLHVVFTAHGFRPDPFDQISPPVEWISEDESFIWHWDSESDTLTLVADGWYDNNGDSGPWDANVSRPSLGADAEGNLYCIFRKTTEDDQDREGDCHGDIYLSVSADGGESWTEPINLTDTHPVNAAGDPEFVDERYPSIAAKVDDYIHITYTLQSELVGGDAEDPPFTSKVIYQRVAVADIPDADGLRFPRNDFTYHNLGGLAVVDENTTAPQNFRIEGVYPNPFNATTVISFDLVKAGLIDVGVFDLTGRRIATVMQGELPVGRHEVVWNAASAGAGVYFVKVVGPEGTLTERMALVR